MREIRYEIADIVKFIKPLHAFRGQASEDEDGRLLFGFGRKASSFDDTVSYQQAERNLSSDVSDIWHYLADKLGEEVFLNLLGRFSRGALVSLYYDIGVAEMESGGSGAFPKNCVLEVLKPDCDVRLVGLTQFRRFVYNGFLKSPDAMRRREAETSYFQRSRCYILKQTETGTPALIL